MRADIKRRIGPFVRRHSQRIVVLLIWLLSAVGFWWYTQSIDLTPIELVWEFTGWTSQSVFGPIFYITAFVLRPILFIPATVMTVVGGFIFGPTLGLIYALIGDVASASAGYLIGRYFGNDLLHSAEEITFVKKNADQMREHSFRTVLILRFLVLPQDLVNYAAGFLRIQWLSYALATAIGAFPGILVYSQFGASLQNPVPGQLQMPKPTILLAPPILVTASLIFTWYWRRRRPQEDEENAGT